MWPDEIDVDDGCTDGIIGWFVTDEAVSGGSMERDGLQGLLTAATQASRPFDCILIDDSSRLTRRLAYTLNLYERLAFAGIRVVAASQGIDSFNPQAELLIVDTGGRCFGYRSVKDGDGGARLEVNEVEAEIVRRVFSLYVESSLSLKSVAHKLNADGVTAPQPRKGRMQSWCVSSARHVLLNRRYAGKIVWNTRRKIRVRGTTKRVFRARPESEWVIVDAPHLRIVSDEMFTVAAARFDKVKRLYGRPGEEAKGLIVAPRRYLFSGLLKCSECDGSITLVCGRGRNGADRYGCSVHHQRGDSLCTNSLLVRRDELERDLLRGLSERVFQADVIEYAVAKMEEWMTEQHAGVDAELERMRARKTQRQAELKRLVDAIAAGAPHQAYSAGIAEREKELQEITDTLLEPRPGSLRTKMDELRTIAMKWLALIRELIAHPEKIAQTHEQLAEKVGCITLEPVVTEGGKRMYVAQGKVDFWSDEESAHFDGAGGQNRTGYARLFRAALYQ